jgi:Icc-related predicted phosphoesterase
MKLHALSDLHIEYADFTIPQTDADVIILAGDIGVGLGGLDWVKTQTMDKPVLYVPGNHEYYQHEISLLTQLRESAPPDVYVLDNDMVEIAGVRFLGCTLWTDFDYFGETDRFFALQNARKNMADFELIRHEGKPFRPEDSIRLHEYSRDWLKCMLDEPFPGKTVVISHHAPASGSVHPRYARNLLTPAFVSNLEHLMDSSRVALWVHGHMHDACDYEVYGTRVICNPRGYAPYEDPEGFKPDWVIEV